MDEDRDIDLDDYSDVAKLAISLIGTDPNGILNDKLRIHKLAFLTDKILKDEDLDEDLDFVPHYMGPYAENLDDSIDKMSNQGIIKKNEIGKGIEYSLTKLGKLVLGKIKSEKLPVYDIAKDVNEDMINFKSMEITSLVYDLYPDFAKNSLIKEKLPKTNKYDHFSINLDSDMNKIEIITTKNGLSLMISREDNSHIIIRGI